MPQVVAIFSPLGGTGKTTLAVNLACQLAESAPVWLIDADDLATATDWMSYGKLPIPGEFLPLEDRSRTDAWIQHVSAKSADVTLIDLPSQLTFANEAALMIANLIIFPIQADFYGRYVGVHWLSWLRKILQRRSDDGASVLLVPCQVDRRTTEGRDIEKALQEMGERVGPAIGWRTAFGASDAAHDWIGAFAPLSRGHQELVALTAVVHAILGSTQPANPHRLY
jgi:chromosome partitioning protein